VVFETPSSGSSNYDPPTSLAISPLDIELVDAAVEMVQSILDPACYEVSWYSIPRLSDPEPLENEAFQEALEEAQDKALRLASLGLRSR
jgi:hypothetical protein